MSLSPTELGYLPPPAVPNGDLPPGDGRWAVPQFQSFAALYEPGYRGQRWTIDEAMAHSAANARVMRNDLSIFDPLRSRQMPTSLLSWHLEPDDENNPSEQTAIQLHENILRRFPYWQRFLMHQLEALWYGKVACQLRYRWDFTKPNPFTGNRRLVPTGHQYFNGDKLRIRFDGSVGVLVHPQFEGTKESTDLGWAHFLTPTERECFVVHQHEPEDADWLDPHLAGGVHGYGIRGRVYWFWYLKKELQSLMLNYAERFANGLTLWFYDASNKAAKNEMADALSSQAGATNLLVPRWGAGRDQNTVERIEVGSAQPQFLRQIIEEDLNGSIRRFILGQTLSSDTAPTGLGSGVAEAHMDTLSKIIKYDAQNLQETITRDLISVLYRYNAPGVTPARFVFDLDMPNATEVLGNAQILQQMGLAVDGEHLYQVTGLPKPVQGDTALTKLQPMSAVGAPVGPDPSEVPAAGEPLPPEEQAAEEAAQQQDLAGQGGGQTVRYQRQRLKEAVLRRVQQRKRGCR
jgi:hypothetical protein